MGPNWLAYFNDFAGGPANGSAWLGGSNFDWGQNLLALKKWYAEHEDIENLYVAVRSHYDPTNIGLEFDPPPPFMMGQPFVRDKHGQRAPLPGWYAVSEDVLQCERGKVCDGHGGGVSFSAHFDYFKRFTPVATVGWSIHIFQITPEDAERLRLELETQENQMAIKPFPRPPDDDLSSSGGEGRISCSLYTTRISRISVETD